MVSLAALGCAVILTGLIIATSTLTIQSRTPGSFLPAEHTKIVVFHPTEVLSQLTSHWSTDLQNIPVDEQIEAYALVETEEGDMSAVLFLQADSPVPEELTSWHQTDIAPYRILSSHQGIVHGENMQQNTLSGHGPFLYLASAFSREDSWLYTHTTVLPLPSSIGEYVLAGMLTRNASHLSLTADGNHVRISAIAPEHRLHEGLETELSHHFEAPSLLVSSMYGIEHWKNVVETLPTDQLQVAHTKAQTLTANILGPDVSFLYDILPLAQQVSTAEVEITASGAVHIALHGSTLEKQLSGKLQHLHASVSSTFDTTEVQSRTFDDRFSATSIRLKRIEETSKQSSLGLWDTLETVDNNQLSLLTTAHNRSNFFVSNHPAGTENLQKKHITSLPRADSVKAANITAGGLLLPHMQETLFDPESTHWKLELLLPEEAAVWSVSQHENMRTLIVEKQT